MKLFLCFLAFFAVFHLNTSFSQDTEDLFLSPDEVEDNEIRYDWQEEELSKDTSDSFIKGGALRITGMTNGQVSARNISIDWELFVGENFSLNYSIGFNKNNGIYSNNFGAFQYLGLAGFGYFMDEYGKHREERENSEYYEEEGFDVVGGSIIVLGIASIAMIVLPEGFSYYIPLNNNTKMSIFYNPFQVDYIDYEYHASFSLGMRTHINLSNNVEVVPSIGYRNLYSSDMSDFGLSSFFFGVSLGISSVW